MDQTAADSTTEMTACETNRTPEVNDYEMIISHAVLRI